MQDYKNEKLIIDPDNIKYGSVSWLSPSNIALVKYWGKHGKQLPMNPSISFTLSTSHTQTKIEYGPRKDMSLPLEFSFEFEGKEKPEFRSRIENYLLELKEIFPFLSQLSLDISSKNSFPHSSGIASSASAMSALALCLCSIEEHFFDPLVDDEFDRKASYVARLGSGSACRSIFPYASVWGEALFANKSSNKHAIDWSDNLHEEFKNYRNSILIVSSSQKQVSSSAGHKLMETHNFKDQRVANANRNAAEISTALKKGDIEKFIHITEKEALELHALMMTSSPSFILMEPETLAVLKKVRQFRKESKVPVAFTLDAGPNVHLLYPEKYSEKMELFITNELLEYCEAGLYLNDHVGKGPVEL